MPKHIRLFEQYTGSREKGLFESHSWADISNAINLKLPFIIIDFEDEQSKLDCVQSELNQEKYEDQIYCLKSDGKIKEYPSIFIFADGSNIIDRISKFPKRFKIGRIIVGKSGIKHPTLLANDRTSNCGPDIITGTGPDDMSNDDYYKFNSSYYKFLNN